MTLMPYHVLFSVLACFVPPSISRTLFAKAEQTDFSACVKYFDSRYGRHNSAAMGTPARRMEMKCRNVFLLGARVGGTERERDGR